MDVLNNTGTIPVIVDVRFRAHSEASNCFFLFCNKSNHEIFELHSISKEAAWALTPLKLLPCKLHVSHHNGELLGSQMENETGVVCIHI